MNVEAKEVICTNFPYRLQAMACTIMMRTDAVRDHHYEKGSELNS